MSEAGTVTPPRPKPGLHLRNRDLAGYDFPALAAASPGLARYVITTAAGTPGIDFANPAAVKAFNRALLIHHYGISGWDIPAGYLCPPVPGRADAIHHVADLLATCNRKVIPTGPRVRIVDIGVGANCIYPLIGHGEYGWRFLGVDIDPPALANAQRILAANPELAAAIELRHQPVQDNIFIGMLRSGESFDLSIRRQIRLVCGHFFSWNLFTCYASFATRKGSFICVIFGFCCGEISIRLIPDFRFLFRIFSRLHRMDVNIIHVQECRFFETDINEGRLHSW